jgi:hypothetical protein
LKTVFLGRIPCDLKARLQTDGLYVTPEGEAYEYGFRDLDGSPWPTDARVTGPKGAWEIEMAFDRPEAGSSEPTVFGIHSAQGEVQVKWKERKVK